MTDWPGRPVPDPSLAVHSVTEGDRVELTCSAYGVPQPSVAWSSADWSEQSGVVGRSTGVLGSARLSDAGVYTCTAQSAAGRSERVLQLVVEVAGGERQAVAGRPAEFVPPPPPHGPLGKVRTDRPLYTVPVNGRAELTCFVEGGCDVTKKALVLDFKM